MTTMSCVSFEIVTATPPPRVQFSYSDNYKYTQINSLRESRHAHAAAGACRKLMQYLCFADDS